MSTDLTTDTGPTVIEFAGRERISSSKWNDRLVAEKVLREAVNEWMSINEIARFVWITAYKENQKRARANIWRLRRYLIVNHNVLLISDGRPMHSIKIYVGGAADEEQIARPLLDQMRKRSDFTWDICQRAENIIRGITYQGVVEVAR